MDALVLRATDPKLSLLERRQCFEELCSSFFDADVGEAVQDLINVLLRSADNLDLALAATIVFKCMIADTIDSHFLEYMWSEVPPEIGEKVIEDMLVFLETEIPLPLRKLVGVVLKSTEGVYDEEVVSRLELWMGSERDDLKFSAMQIAVSENFLSSLLRTGTVDKHLESILGLVQRKDAPHLQSAAILLFLAVASEKKKYMAQIPVLLPVITSFTSLGQDEPLYECISGFSMLFVRSYASAMLPSILTFLDSVVRDERVSLVCVRIALEATISSMSADSISSEDIARTLLGIYTAGLLRIQENPLWATCELEFPYDDLSGLVVHSACAGVVSVLNIDGANGFSVRPLLAQALDQFRASPDWKHQYAGLRMLSSFIGVANTASSEARSASSFPLAMLKSKHPHVLSEACDAIYGIVLEWEEEQKPWSISSAVPEEAKVPLQELLAPWLDQGLPLLIELMATHECDHVRRSAASACAALFDFSKHAPALSSVADTAMTAAISMLQHSPLATTQGEALEVLSSVAKACPQQVARFYPFLLQPLMKLVREGKDLKYAILRFQALHCICSLGFCVPPARFAIDIASALGVDDLFQPKQPEAITMLLKSIGVIAEILKNSIPEAMLGDLFSFIHNLISELQGGKKWYICFDPYVREPTALFSESTARVDEEIARSLPNVALRALQQLLEHCKLIMTPNLQEIIDLLNCSFSYQYRCDEDCVKTIPFLVRAGLEAQIAGQQVSVDVFDAMFTGILNFRVIDQFDYDPFVARSYFAAFRECLVAEAMVHGDLRITSDKVEPAVNAMKKFLCHRIKGLDEEGDEDDEDADEDEEEVDYSSGEDNEDYNDNYQGDDGEEEEEEHHTDEESETGSEKSDDDGEDNNTDGSEESEESEDNEQEEPWGHEETQAAIQMTELIEFILKLRGKKLLPALDPVFKLFAKAVNMPESSPTLVHFGINVFSDILSACKEGAEHYAAEFVPKLIEVITTGEPNMRQSACFAAGLLASEGGLGLFPAARLAVPQLWLVVRDVARSRLPENVCATENAMVSLLRIARAGAMDKPFLEFLEEFLGLEPMTHDVDECKYTYSTFCDLLQSAEIKLSPALQARIKAWFEAALDAKVLDEPLQQRWQTVSAALPPL